MPVTVMGREGVEATDDYAPIGIGIVGDPTEAIATLKSRGRNVRKATRQIFFGRGKVEFCEGRDGIEGMVTDGVEMACEIIIRQVRHQRLNQNSGDRLRFRNGWAIAMGLDVLE